MKNQIIDLAAEKLLVLDLSGKRTKKSLMEAIGEHFKLPKHFGHNWDALADCLMDADWAKASGYSIVIIDSAAAKKRFGEDWDTLIDLLDEASEWWQERDKAFNVVLV
ncbi:MAG: barnase inhibitor [Burkholderiales bacterium]|nr:MAG: barnase inhibitor [Burkholderiales bacterium]TAG77064.1 MAG: barnase inhibitor [Betaproteobacteria bacterium]